MKCTCNDSDIEGCERARSALTASRRSRGLFDREVRRTARVSDNPVRRLAAQAFGLGLGLAMYMAVRALSAASSNEAIHNASRLLRFEEPLFPVAPPRFLEGASHDPGHSDGPHCDRDGSPLSCRHLRRGSPSALPGCNSLAIWERTTLPLRSRTSRSATRSLARQPSAWAGSVW